MANQPNIKKVEIPINKAKIPVSPNNTFPVQYRIASEDGSKISAWSNIIEVAAPAVVPDNILTMVNKIGTSKKVSLSWDDENNANLYDIFVYRFQNINLSTRGYGQFSKTATEATVTLYTGSSASGTKMKHGLKVGMTIAIANTSTDFDIASTTVTAVSDDYTFTYSPVPTATVTSRGDSTSTITAAAVQTTTLDINDYIYVDKTEKNYYNLSKSFRIGSSVDGTTFAANSTHMFTMVQVASSDKKPNSLLTVGFANLATP